MSSITRRGLAGFGEHGGRSCGAAAFTRAHSSTLSGGAARPGRDAPLRSRRHSAALIDIPPTTSTIADRDRREQWWHEARFGMFIHFGLYSVLRPSRMGYGAGRHSGSGVSGTGETISIRAHKQHGNGRNWRN